MSSDFTSAVVQALAQNRAGLRILNDFAGRQVDGFGARGAHSAMKFEKPLEMLKGQFGPVGPQVIRFRVQRERELERRSQFFIILPNLRLDPP